MKCDGFALPISGIMWVLCSPLPKMWDDGVKLGFRYCWLSTAFHLMVTFSWYNLFMHICPFILVYGQRMQCVCKTKKGNCCNNFNFFFFNRILFRVGFELYTSLLVLSSPQSEFDLGLNQVCRYKPKLVDNMCAMLFNYHLSSQGSWSP